jgi:hypothetical protein
VSEPTGGSIEIDRVEDRADAELDADWRSSVTTGSAAIVVGGVSPTARRHPGLVDDRR